jgi:adenine-specific DNA-methyltransferase
MSTHERINERKFFDALRDIFVGARIEGESGYINLMRIKSRYYAEGVFPKLQEKIDEELQPFPAFREEMFDKLYSFFKRYFSDSGSIYFRHTPYYQDIYERIYTDDRDVMLFWKTQNLYYVKTDRLFRSMTLNLDDAPDQKFAFDASAVERQSFNFDASGLQNKRNNEKRNLIFEYKGKGEDETLKFAVQYTEGGKKTKTDDILKAIKKDGVAVNEDQLTRAFRLFERQSEVDFFINKNAKAFLEEQFDLWMYQYLFKRESDWTEKRIREMQALKRVARGIIEFISQFEDELVRIWNKPKFALRSNYVITFDRVFSRSEELARKLLAHENIEEQIAEWRELGMIDEQFTIESIFREDEEAAPKTKKKRAKQAETLSFDEDAGALESEAIEDADLLPELSAKYRFLPFDTKHFKSLEREILSLFDNLDEELDGRLVHSENYQALNTLKDKFRERVKCIYIDPPYNTGSDAFIYTDTFRHSAWLSMMDDRLEAARNFIQSDGTISISADDVEISNLLALLNRDFGESNSLATLIWDRNRKNDATFFSVGHEYMSIYAQDKAFLKANKIRFREQKIGFVEANKKFDELSEKHNKNWVKVEKDWRKWIRSLTDKRKRKQLGRFLKISSKGPYRDDGNINWPGGDGPDYDILHPVTKEPVKKPISGWRYATAEDFWKRYNDGYIKFGADESTVPSTITYLFEKNEEVLPSVFYSYAQTAAQEFDSLFGKRVFDNPKNWRDIGRIVNYLSQLDDLTIDFFAGSGTTAHAVINLNREDGGRRKYILVEANHYFYTVILPRIKKVVFSDKWKDGKASSDGAGISHFIKYFTLEQYEDTLHRASYLNDSESDQPAFFDNPYESPFASYVFLRDQKMADALRIDYENDKISVDFSKLYPDIDLAETLSCVKGKFIKSLTAESVTFADGETVEFDELDYRDVLPLIWWDK